MVELVGLHQLIGRWSYIGISIMFGFTCNRMHSHSPDITFWPWQMWEIEVIPWLIGYCRGLYHLTHWELWQPIHFMQWFTEILQETCLFHKYRGIIKNVRVVNLTNNTVSSSFCSFDLLCSKQTYGKCPMTNNKNKAMMRPSSGIGVSLHLCAGCYTV